MPDPRIKARIETTGVDPKEVAAIEKSLKGKEVAPRISEQSGSFVDWQQIRDQLGQPHLFDRTPPLRKLREIRRDPMVAFGMHYRKTPLVRVQWHMEARDKNGANAQVAGFMDSAWRQIHARYIMQHTTDFDFGFATMVKRFKLGNPGGTYYDALEEDPDKALKPVWDEGKIEPVIWKPFVGLPPERVAANFTPDGEFDGINYETIAVQQAGRGTGMRAKTKKGDDKFRDIDVYHSLWTTNDKDSVFGSIYGYPLIAHAYRFWWSYWFLWGNLDRAFERSAVPPLIAYHPEGAYTDEDGLERPYWEIALEAAERLRSNAIAAIPSTMATAGLDEKGTTMREWAFEFLESPTSNYQALNEHLSYLDVMKLRAIWVPEQAFIEGEGGSSSRNVATQMAEIFNGSQENKWEEISDHINRFIIPQLLAVNFPEFVNNGGTCRIIGHGFQKEDTEFLKQIIQLVGQGDPLSLGIDMKEALSRIGAPLLTPQELAKQQAEAVAAAQAASPPPVAPGLGQVGVVPNPGFTNGGSVPEPNAPGASVTGFADQPYIYVNPRPVIELSEHDDYLAGLPPTSHYKDKTMRALSVQMRKLWIGALREAYPDFARYIIKQNLTLALADEDEEFAAIELADPDRARKKAERLAKKLVNGWAQNNTKLVQLAQRSKQIADKMVRRAVKLGNNNADHEKLAETYDEFLNRQVGRLIKSVTGTTKENIRTLLVNDIMEGKGVQEIGRNIQEHFAEFPDYRADRIARSETRDAFNFGTLLAAKEAGLKFARAKDAQHGPTDAECEERDGKLYTVTEALSVSWNKTHPNDTLEWEPVARASFSIENVQELPAEAPKGADAWYDSTTDTAYVPFALSDEETAEFLGAVVESF